MNNRGRFLVRAGAGLIVVSLALAGAAAPAAAAKPPGAGPTNPLATWHAALDRSATDPTDVVVLGDSITQGFLSTRTDWFVDVVRRRLQSPRGGGGVGYLPATPAAPTLWPTPLWSVSGGTSALTGLGLRSYVLNTATAFASATVTTDRLELHYRVGPGSGQLAVAIDGQPAATLDALSTTAGVRTWRSVALPRGEHTIRVEPVVISGAVAPVTIDGVMVFDGDLSAGVRIWESGHGGYTSQHFVNNQTWADQLVGIDPDLVIIELGTNDAVAMGVSTFEANLNRIIDRIMTINPVPPSVLLMPLWKRPDVSSVTASAFAEAQRRVARNRRVGIVDLSGVDPTLLTLDGIHPNTIGQRVMANALLDAIDPAYVPVTTPPSAPASASAVAGTPSGTATVSWTAVAGTTQYSVRARNTATGVVTTPLQQVSGTSALVSGLAAGATYTFTVHAGNDAGYSSGTTSNAVTIAASTPPPLPPSNVVGSASSATSITVTWSAPAGATSYLVQAFDMTTSQFLSQQSVTEPTATFGGLTPVHSYAFAVYARNDAGYSAATASNTIAL